MKTKKKRQNGNSYLTCFWWFFETSSIRTRSVALPCSSITSLLSGDSFRISWFCTRCMLSYMSTRRRGTRRLLTSPPEGPSRCTYDSMVIMRKTSEWAKKRFSNTIRGGRCCAYSTAQRSTAQHSIANPLTSSKESDNAGKQTELARTSMSPSIYLFRSLCSQN